MIMFLVVFSWCRIIFHCVGHYLSLLVHLSGVSELLLSNDFIPLEYHLMLGFEVEG